MNTEILQKIANLDYEQVSAKIGTFLQEQVSINNSYGIILGLSGGIDSTVTAFLCSRVLKEKTLALIMPDSEITPKTETEDALNVVDKLGIDYKLIDIQPLINEYSKYLEPNEFAKGNLRARVRTNILYYYANAKNFLVTGSSDKSEYLIGYFTKYGDGAADITPIISLYKTQVKKLAEFLHVPKHIIEKKSSPHLWKEHVAEDEIGNSYEIIDTILYCLFDQDMSIEDTAMETKIGKETIERIFYMYQESKHKREIPVMPME